MSPSVGAGVTEHVQREHSANRNGREKQKGDDARRGARPAPLSPRAPCDRDVDGSPPAYKSEGSRRAEDAVIGPWRSNCAIEHAYHYRSNRPIQSRQYPVSPRDVSASVVRVYMVDYGYHICLTAKLSGRTPVPTGRRGRILLTCSRGASHLTHHGPLQRKLEAGLPIVFHLRKVAQLRERTERVTNEPDVPVSPESDARGQAVQDDTELT
jgi:hypothetical protein